jgi:hypothetical protein
VAYFDIHHGFFLTQMKVTSIARKKSTTNPRPISAKGESRAKTLQEGKKKKPSITPHPTPPPPPPPRNPPPPTQRTPARNEKHRTTKEKRQERERNTKKPQLNNVEAIIRPRELLPRMTLNHTSNQVILTPHLSAMFFVSLLRTVLLKPPIV